MKDSERRAEEKTSVETSSLLKALANHNEKPEDVEAAFCHSEGETIRCSFEDLLKRELNPLKKSAPIIVFTKSRIYFSFFYEYFNRILSVPRNPENVKGQISNYWFFLTASHRGWQSETISSKNLERRLHLRQCRSAASEFKMGSQAQQWILKAAQENVSPAVFVCKSHGRSE